MLFVEFMDFGRICIHKYIYIYTMLECFDALLMPV